MVYDSRENCNAIIEKNTNTLILGCQNTEIANSVASIGESAFYYCSALASVKIPDNVTSIGSRAFFGCKALPGAEIPESVTSIGDKAFGYYNDKEMEKVYEGSLGGTDIGVGITYIDSKASAFTIRGKNNSEAERYARDNGFTFHISISDVPDDNKDDSGDVGEDMSISEHKIVFYPWFINNPDAGWTTSVSLGVDWGWKLFNQQTSDYDNRFTIAGLSLSAAAEKSHSSAENTLKNLGFDTKEPISYNYDQPWYQVAQPGVTFGYKCITDRVGDKQHIFAIVIRGTSNAADLVTDLSSVVGGFSMSTEFIQTLLESYILDCGLRPEEIKNNVKFFITGHSLGGAVANISAKKLNDIYGAEHVYAYTFATPPCITQIQYSLAQNANNIFNFLNVEDTVPLLETTMKKRYGIDFCFSRLNEPVIYENFKILTNGRDLKAIMESWWPWKELKDKILCAHSVDTYMSCLMGQKDEAFAKAYLTTVKIFCPVDIEIYVAIGNKNLLIGRIVNNVVDEDVSNGVYINIDGDKKNIYLPYEGEYTFKMTGTDSGTMKYAVQSTNMDTGEVVSEKTFAQVQLFDGKQMCSDVEVKDGIVAATDGELPDVKLFVLDGQGEIEKEVLADGLGTETVIKEESKKPAVETGGKKTISDNNVTISPTSYTYDGTAKTPVVNVKDGNTVLKADTDYTVIYENNVNAGTAKVTVTGKGNYEGTVTKTFTITIQKGTFYVAGAYKYQVTDASTVSMTGINSKSTVKVKVPKTVTVGGKVFKVTAIGKNAFRKNTKITGVEIGDNVKTIGASAFEGCTKLTKVTVGKSVTEISGSVFKNCKKLGTITIKSTSLKKVGKNALKGIKSTAKIKVPKKKLSAYKKILKNKGQGKKVKITK